MVYVSTYGENMIVLVGLDNLKELVCERLHPQLLKSLIVRVSKINMCLSHKLLPLICYQNIL